METNNKRTLTVEYAVRPSLVAKRLGKKLTTESATLFEGARTVWRFDAEEGAVKVDVPMEDLQSATEEIVSILRGAKLPIAYDGEPLLFTKSWAFTSGAEVALMESSGFRKDDLTHLWVLKGEAPETRRTSQTTV